MFCPFTFFRFNELLFVALSSFLGNNCSLFAVQSSMHSAEITHRQAGSAETWSNGLLSKFYAHHSR